MTLPRDTMLDLMAYADGELEGEERARVEAIVAANPEAKRVVDAMRSLGDDLRLAEDTHAPRVDAADVIADQVMAKIAHEGPAAHDMGALVSLAQRRNVARARATAAVVAVLALAAGALLFLRNGQSSNPVAANAPHPSVASSEPGATASSVAGELPAAVANAATEVDLEEVESAEHRVSVFYVPKGSSEGTGSTTSSVVIWIDDHASMGGK